MIDESLRTAILELAKKGFGTRRIARALGISRGAVRAVIESGAAKPPKILRPEKAEPYRDQILDLYSYCRGNLVRVHEELNKDGAKISYQALTAFCRRHEIGRATKPPAGRYDFAPAQEMQHDTSPYPFKIGGKTRPIQIASLVLGYSRMIFIELYPCFTRFECKLFLTDALTYFDGACDICMVDNTSVIRLKGTGKDMVPVPEMVCFGERFDFQFAAHEVGDANRSARVEGHFKFAQNNFFAGRTFVDWDDLNAQARTWCDEVNAKYSRKLRASRRELFATESLAMKRLPDFVPEVYVLHHRIVDAEGYVNVRRNRYSVPYKLIGRDMEVRESKERIDVFDGPRRVASHRRVIDPVDAYVTEPKHRPPRGEGRAKKGPPPEQLELSLVEPSIAGYVAALARHAHGRGVRALQRLLRMVREYPRQPLIDAIREAEQFGLYDLDRIERMVLRRIDREYFTPPDFDSEPPPTHEDDDDDEG
ncbi:MAG: transposase [Thermoanaerobaculales bacterium]